MEIHEAKKIIDNNKKQLSVLLTDCQNGPAELKLLASQMNRLLNDFSAKEQEFFSETPVANAKRINDEI